MQLATLPMAERATGEVLRPKEWTVAAALKDLHSDDARLRQDSAEALADYPEYWERTSSALLHALDDSEAGVRAGAARAIEAVLVLQSDERAVAALAGRLSDASEEVRAASAFALWRAERIPESAAEPLSAVLASDSPVLRVAGGVALVKHFPETARRLVRRASLASDARDLARRKVDEALTEPEQVATEEPCAEPRAESLPVTENPIESAGRFGAAAAFLSPRIGATWLDELVRRFDAGWTDAMYAARPMAPYLAGQLNSRRSRLSSPDAEVRRAAIVSVGLVGQADTGTLRALAGDVIARTATAKDSARALGLIGERAKPVVPDLQRALLEIPNGELRERVADALIQVDWDSVEPTAKKLEETDPDFSKWLLVRAIEWRL